MSNKEQDEIKFDEFLKDITVIGKENELREKWAKKIQTADKEYKDQSRNRILGFVAILILSLSLIYYFNSNEGLRGSGAGNIAEAKTALLENLNFREGPSETNIWEPFRTAVSENRYSEAAVTFRETQGDSGTIDKLLYAIALINVNEFEESERILNSIINENNLFSTEAEWILANSYLKSERNVKAISLLSRLEKNENSYSDKASELLRKLKK